MAETHDRPIVRSEEVLDAAAMVEEAVPFYEKNPNATMRESYEWLTERHTLGIKLKTWTNGHATQSMALAHTPDRPKDVEIATGETENDSQKPDHPKVTVRATEFDGMERVVCAGCSVPFMLDADYKAAHMESGEFYSCPNGCWLTYDKAKEELSVAKVEAGAPIVENPAPMPREPLTFEFGDKKLRAVPVNDGGTQWHVEFDGVISDFALNMIMADIWDRVLERQVDGDGGGGEWPLRGSMLERIESSITSLDHKVEWALKRAGIEL